MKKRRNRRYDASSLLKNRKSQTILLLVLFSAAIFIASGMDLGAQAIFGYDDRAFTHAWLGIEVKNSQVLEDNTIETAEFISMNPFPGYFNRWHCFFKGYVYFYTDTAAANIVSAHLSIEVLDPATYEPTVSVYSNNLDGYTTTTVDSRPVGVYSRQVNIYLGGDAGTGGGIDVAGTLFKATWIVSDADGVQEVYELPMALFQAPPDISAPPEPLPDINLQGPDDFTHYEGDTAVPLTWSWNPLLTMNTIRLSSSVGSGNFIAISGSSWTFDQNDPGTHMLIWDDSLGAHTYAFEATDIHGRGVTDTVIVTVEEQPLVPLVEFTSVPNDLTVNQGEVGNAIVWTFTGYMNIIGINLWEGLTNLYSYGDYFSNTFSFTVDGLSVGSHELRLVIGDSNGFTVEDTVIVTVLNVPPQLSSPADVSFEEGIPDMEIWWDLSEENLLATLVISGDMSGTYYPDTQLGYIQVVVSGLSVGEYDYTLTVEDIYGAEDVDVVHVSVLEQTFVDVTSPSITHPNDVSGIEGISGTLEWTVTDESSGDYVVARSGSTVASGSWDSGDTITYDFTESVAGSYTYVITLTDDYGNEVSDSVVVLAVEGFDDTTGDDDIFAFLYEPIYTIGDYTIQVWMALVGLFALLLIISAGSKRRRSEIVWSKGE